MNLIILFADDCPKPDTAVLTGRRLEHLRDVLRSEPGENCRVGLLNGLIGSGRVTKLTEDAATLSLEFHTAPPLSLPLTLICALPRPKTLKKVVQCAVALGIKKLFFIETWKVNKSYWTSPLANAVGLWDHIILGLEQAKDTVMPEVQFRRRFKPFVEDELPGIVGDSLGLTAHPDAPEPCPVRPGGPITLCIGPEGGFTDYEVEQLTAHGCCPVHLGNRPLRTEFALPALVGRLC